MLKYSQCLQKVLKQQGQIFSFAILWVWDQKINLGDKDQDCSFHLLTVISQLFHWSEILEHMTDRCFWLPKCVLLNRLFKQLITMNVYYCFWTLGFTCEDCVCCQKKLRNEGKLIRATAQALGIQQYAMSGKTKKWLAYLHLRIRRIKETTMVW